MTNIKLAIFDLDGTLYDQHKLRKKYLFQLLFSLLTFRLSIEQFFILSKFRKWREENKSLISKDLKNKQFELFSLKYNYPPERTKETVTVWMYEKPLPYLKECIYPHCADFFEHLNKQGIKTAIFSDYPIDKKLSALGLSSDFNLCSSDEALNQFKPNGEGLKKICQYFKVKPEESVYFGDREDTDGKSAILAGIKFVKVERLEASSKSFFKQQIENFS